MKSVHDHFTVILNYEMLKVLSNGYVYIFAQKFFTTTHTVV